MHHHTIREPPPCLTVGTTHCGLYLSPTLLRTYARLDPQKSSDELTSDHRSTVQFRGVRAKFRRALTLASRSNGFFAATQPRKPAEFNRFRMVDAQTVTPLSVSVFCRSCGGGETEFREAEVNEGPILAYRHFR